MAEYAVIGVGGVGGFYGVQLLRAGADVHFLIRSAPVGASQLTLRTGGEEVRADLPPTSRIHREWATLPQVDIAVVAVKATANAEVVDLVPRIVRPGGSIVLIQNGIDAEPAFAAAAGSDVDVVGGLAFLASHRAGATRFVHVDYGTLTLARYADQYQPGGTGTGMTSLQSDLERAGVAVVLAPDLLAARWQKLAWNIPFNGLSVLLDARTDELVADPSATSLALDLMQEVMAAASGDGRRLPPGLPDRMLDLTREMRPYAPSMRLDFQERRALEVDALYRAAVRRAARAGVAMPRTEALAEALEFLDRRNRGQMAVASQVR